MSLIMWPYELVMKSSDQPDTTAESVLDRLFHRCEGAYAESTLRSYRYDVDLFRAWCSERQLPWLPAAPQALAAFVGEQTQSMAIATIRRRVEAVKFMHRMADVPSPAAHSEVRLALRRARRAQPGRPAQSLGLTAEILQKIVASCPDTPKGLRDAALISTGYDTLCRSSELTAMHAEHLSENCDRIYVPRSKTDPFGSGRMAYLSGATSKRLQAWLSASGITEGPLFRGMHTGTLSDQELRTCSIRRLVKVAAKRAQLDAESVRSLSGHSMRVGAAQDMMVAGIDSVGIMHAGGWKSQAVLSRYVENASAELMHERRWEGLKLLNAV